MKTKYHPILFSTPMVQAIQENRKTQTRRTKGLELFNERPNSWRYDGISELDGSHYMELISKDGKFTEKYFEVKCPYNVGDVLWVRETFHENTAEQLKGTFYYKALIDEGWKLKWKPSLFMPKIACRTFLKIKSIRAERLNEISEEDSIAEGINSEPWALDNEVTLFENYTNYGEPFYSFSTYQWNFGKEEHTAAVASFCTLWEDINGEDSWNKNPFVWVYEFERINKPKDFGV